MAPAQVSVIPYPVVMTLRGDPYLSSKEDASIQVLTSFAYPPDARIVRLDKSHVNVVCSDADRIVETSLAKKKLGANERETRWWERRSRKVIGEETTLAGWTWT